MGQQSAVFDHLNQDLGPSDLGLYIHVPFCYQRCHFCAFYLTRHRESEASEFVSALEKEIALWGNELSSKRVSTVYLGGGTPTSLSVSQLQSLLHAVRKAFRVTDTAEITLEATPDTVSKEGLTRLRECGVTRLSLGAQSFDPAVWRGLGRSGECHTTGRAVEMARGAGIQNINLDVMYGLPEQNLDSWRHSLAWAHGLEPTHLSCYALMVEEGTLWYDRRRHGNLQQNHDLENLMYDYALCYLGDRGYRHYELSNFAVPPFECRHNLRYWTGKAYLGLGPSAQSFIGRVRFGNAPNLTVYRQWFLGQGRPNPGYKLEFLTSEQTARERMVFGLRLVDGVTLPRQDIERLGVGHILDALVLEGLLDKRQHRYRLTPRGRYHADGVAFELA